MIRYKGFWVYKLIVINNHAAKYFCNFCFNQESFQHSRHVGKRISTKKVGSDEREDVTNLYKYNKNTPEERKAFENAYSFGMGRKAWIGESVNLKEGKDLTLGIWTRLNLFIKSSAQ